MTNTSKEKSDKIRFFEKYSMIFCVHSRVPKLARVAHATQKMGFEHIYIYMHQCSLKRDKMVNGIKIRTCRICTVIQSTRQYYSVVFWTCGSVY